MPDPWREIDGGRDMYDFEIEDIGLTEGPSSGLPTSLPGLPPEEREDDQQAG